MRVKGAGAFRPDGWHAFHGRGPCAARDGGRFAAAGTAHETAPLACTVLACRVSGCADPWRILTDLPPAAADPCRYAPRSGIERGFRVPKRGGWQWRRTRMTDPARAERPWVVLAAATRWLVEVGGRAEFEPRPETVPPFRAAGSGRPGPGGCTGRSGSGGV